MKAPRRGCCTGCEGTGFSGDPDVPGGKCWDCRGTGCAHDGHCGILHTANIGRSRHSGWQTVDELVAELLRLKESGCPGSATVHAAPPGSTAFAEASWVAPLDPHAVHPVVASNHTKGCPAVTGTGVCPPCERQRKIKDTSNSRTMLDLLARSSVGEGMEMVRSSPYLCPTRNASHTVSGNAEAAEVTTTRCTSCRQQVHKGEDNRWRVGDGTTEPDFAKELGL